MIDVLENGLTASIYMIAVCNDASYAERIEALQTCIDKLNETEADWNAHEKGNLNASDRD